MPYYTHRQCSVADEESGLIWTLGGNTCTVGYRYEVYYYTSSANTWSHHSNMDAAVIDPACGIVRRASGEKWLLVVKSHQAHAVTRYDLTNSAGWTHISNLWNNYNAYQMLMVTLDPFAPLLIGSGSQMLGTSLRNFWGFNLVNDAFEDGYHYLQNELAMGSVTTFNRTKHYKALENCMAVRTHVAVGWGGATYSSIWSVMLRRRTKSGNSKLPLSCHGKIPPLSPGKLTPGVTAVGYWLLVCGGRQKGKLVEATCHKLDTQKTAGEATWTEIAAMPIGRRDFGFVTYAGAAFAIAGQTDSTETDRVDRWTTAGAWTEMAKLPIASRASCAVSDEGYDSIYVLGGNTGVNMKTAYRYKVSENAWSSLPDLKWAVSTAGCVILNQKGNGRKSLLLVGNSDSTLETQYYDFSTMVWKTGANSQYTMKRTVLVSLTPTESYAVSFIFNFKPINCPILKRFISGKPFFSKIFNNFEFEVFEKGQIFKTNLGVCYLCIEESFDTTSNMGIKIISVMRGILVVIFVFKSHF